MLRSAGLAVDLTAGKLGLHWWYLVGIGLVTLVIGWLLLTPDQVEHVLIPLQRACRWMMTPHRPGP